MPALAKRKGRVELFRLRAHPGRALAQANGLAHVCRAKRKHTQFGYFTLSDNYYADNRREANAFVADIPDEAARPSNT
jgi:hypothetical protein